ncbi:hypothetical protein FACS1894126_0470 [Alphaproteobacteria bacterium]|nr:hypothetical protein FACS1894126_0470 [Alphaproteobacteria bacterium]
MDTLIKSIEKKIDDLCKEQKDQEDKIKLLCEVKGVGRVSAIKLLAHMPELGTFNRRESAALAGVAPCAKDSGKKHGYRRTKGGRQIIKKALYMVALSAIRSGKMKVYYQSLLSRGKKKMVALTACKRKIVTQLNAILRDGKIIQNNA